MPISIIRHGYGGLFEFARTGGKLEEIVAALLQQKKEMEDRGWVFEKTPESTSTGWFWLAKRERIGPKSHKHSDGEHEVGSTSYIRVFPDSMDFTEGTPEFKKVNDILIKKIYSSI